MSAPPFILSQTEEFKAVIAGLRRSPQNAAKLRKIEKTLRLLRDVGPRHPGLQSHLYQSMKGPNGAQLWESYVENSTPSAWRLFWVYGPNPDELTMVTVGPHP